SVVRKVKSAYGCATAMSAVAGRSTAETAVAHAGTADTAAAHPPDITFLTADSTARFPPPYPATSTHRRPRRLARTAPHNTPPPAPPAAARAGWPAPPRITPPRGAHP